MILGDERAEAGDFGEILADELIDQASFADLVLGMFGIVRAHFAAQRRGDFVLGEAANFLDVEFAVEQVGVDPLAAGLKETAVFRGRWIAEGFRHFLAGAQGGQRLRRMVLVAAGDQHRVHRVVAQHLFVI